MARLRTYERTARHEARSTLAVFAALALAVALLAAAGYAIYVVIHIMR